jgi:hypothetical protein
LAPSVHFDFPHDWRVHLLQAPPMIAPARSFVYPQKVAGEEDALARGALLLDVHPAAGGNFLATCALGFEGDGPLSGVWSCPNPAELCAVAGGYAYLIDTRATGALHASRAESRGGSARRGVARVVAVCGISLHCGLGRRRIGVAIAASVVGGNHAGCNRRGHAARHGMGFDD